MVLCITVFYIFMNMSVNRVMDEVDISHDDKDRQLTGEDTNNILVGPHYASHRVDASDVDNKGEICVNKISNMTHDFPDLTIIDLSNKDEDKIFGLAGRLRATSSPEPHPDMGQPEVNFNSGDNNHVMTPGAARRTWLKRSVTKEKFEPKTIRSDQGQPNNAAFEDRLLNGKGKTGGTLGAAPRSSLALLYARVADLELKLRQREEEHQKEINLLNTRNELIFQTSLYDGPFGTQNENVASSESRVRPLGGIRALWQSYVDRRNEGVKFKPVVRNREQRGQDGINEADGSPDAQNVLMPFPLGGREECVSSNHLNDGNNSACSPPNYCADKRLHNLNSPATTDVEGALLRIAELEGQLFDARKVIGERDTIVEMYFQMQLKQENDLKISGMEITCLRNDMVKATKQIKRLKKKLSKARNFKSSYLEARENCRENDYSANKDSTSYSSVRTAEYDPPPRLLCSPLTFRGNSDEYMDKGNKLYRGNSSFSACTPGTELSNGKEVKLSGYQSDITSSSSQPRRSNGSSFYTKALSLSPLSLSQQRTSSYSRTSYSPLSSQLSRSQLSSSRRRSSNSASPAVWSPLACKSSADTCEYTTSRCKNCANNCNTDDILSTIKTYCGAVICKLCRRKVPIRNIHDHWNGGSCLGNIYGGPGASGVRISNKSRKYLYGFSRLLKEADCNKTQNGAYTFGISAFFANPNQYGHRC